MRAETEAQTTLGQMSYVQFFASSADWLTSEEYFVYRDDRDEIDPEKVKKVLRTITQLAEEDQTIVVIHSICHHHIDDGRQCSCAQYANSSTEIDGRQVKGKHRNV